MQFLSDSARIDRLKAAVDAAFDDIYEATWNAWALRHSDEEWQVANKKVDACWVAYEAALSNYKSRITDFRKVN